MKVCMLTDAWMPVWGGGQEHVLRVSEVLRQNYGHQVDIVAPTLVDSKFNFHNFADRVKFTFWLLKFLLTSDFDLYHSHSFSTSIFLPIAKLRGKKTAITVHGMGDKMIGGGILNTLGIPRLLMYLVLNVWPHDFRFSASHLNGFTLVGNGVDVAEYDAVTVAKNPKTFRIVWAGRKYDPIKGVKFLEEAVKQLTSRQPNVALDIVETVYGQAKIKRFKQADLFVLPSLSEGLPLVLLESMASKVPIVTSDVGDCRKVVESANCGLVVPPGDIIALMNALEIVIRMKPSKRAKLGENGYNFVKEKYTWERVAAIYQKSYGKS